MQKVPLLVVDDTIAAQNVSRKRQQWYFNVGDHVWITGHVRSSCKHRDLAKVFYVKVGFVGDDVGRFLQGGVRLVAVKNGHCVWTDAPFESDSGNAQQQRLCGVLRAERLVPCHLSAYELAAVVDEGEKGALAVHHVRTMLDKGVEREVAARDGVGRGPMYDVEGK